MAESVYLGLGSNLGDRLENIINGLKEIAKIAKVEAVSSVYESEPWGEKYQPKFLNAVALVEYEGPPKKLLFELKMIERKLGRQPSSSRWGPRELDIDILLFGEDVLESESLCIPHKYLCQRDFFLVPLLELNPELVHPETMEPLESYLVRLPSQLRTILGKVSSKKWDLITLTLIHSRRKPK